MSLSTLRRVKVKKLFMVPPTGKRDPKLSLQGLKTQSGSSVDLPKSMPKQAMAIMSIDMLKADLIDIITVPEKV